jgi:hypothetical protein
MDSNEKEHIANYKSLCEIAIKRLTEQMEKASYWKKPWYWKNRLWWKDRLASIVEYENNLDKTKN